MCCWPVIEDVQLDRELEIGLLEEAVRRGRWMMAEVGLVGDIGV